MTTMKLKILRRVSLQVMMQVVNLAYQFADVDSAEEGALMRNGTISLGYSQVIPSQPIAKKVLKTKRKTAATTPGPDPPTDVTAANTTIDNDIPTAPNSINGRLPIFSIRNTGIQDARKYSVPLQAARTRDKNGDSPISFSYIVAA